MFSLFAGFLCVCGFCVFVLMTRSPRRTEGIFWCSCHKEISLYSIPQYIDFSVEMFVVWILSQKEEVFRNSNMGHFDCFLSPTKDGSFDFVPLHLKIFLPPGSLLCSLMS